MLGKYVLTKEKKPKKVDVLVWAKWFEDVGNRRVEESEIDGYWISTVFLGIDHQFGNGPPLLFETMIFNKESGKPWFDHYCKRYTTWVQAYEGH